MDRSVGVVCAATLLGSMVIGAALVSRAGPLDPPAGPVAGTYKTLAEVEPRVAINDTNTPGDADSIFRISARGSYYLTSSINLVAGKSGIEIAAGNVTIDMRGFRIFGSGSANNSLDAVSATTTGSGIAVKNGTIHGASLSGINLQSATGCTVEGMIVENCGGDGVLVGNGCRVLSCDLRSNGVKGVECGSSGVISGCTMEYNGDSGMYASTACSISDCSFTSNGFTGLYAYRSCSIERCSAYDNGSQGFGGYSGVTIRGCASGGNGGDGIGLDVAGTVVECSTAYNLGAGVSVTSDCLVARCTAVANGNNGIVVQDGCAVEGCLAENNDKDGIRAQDQNVITNCSGRFAGNGGSGAHIHITGDDNRVEHNNGIDGARGIDVDGTNNLIVGNCITRCTTYFTIVANNKVGQIVAAVDSPAISGTTGGTGVGTSSPWSNISY